MLRWLVARSIFLVRLITSEIFLKEKALYALAQCLNVPPTGIEPISKV